MRSRHLAVAALAAAAAVSGLAVTAGPAGANAPEDEQALAERFAPVVRLVHQDVECGPGEPYRPSDVESVLGDRSVALRGPWDERRIVRVGPTADELGEGLSGYYLDFPGNPLDAGCDYERWARVAAADTAPTTYAHVVTEEGHEDRVALQYWLFYPFNDYTNKHEGDWEVVQLVFAAADAARGARTDPDRGRLQPARGRRGRRAGTTPSSRSSRARIRWSTPPPGRTRTTTSPRSSSVRRPSRGSAATTPAGRADDVRPAVAVVPADPAAAVAEFPWLAYQGRWGQREESFYNGPTGPNTKDQLDPPRQRPGPRRAATSATPFPPAGSSGTSATDFFCSAVSSGSEVVRKLAEQPLRLLLILALLAALAIYLLRRTTWTTGRAPALARRRATGQVIRAAGRMYASRWRMFIGIGFLTVPVSLVVSGLQSLILGAPTSRASHAAARAAATGSSWPRW